MPQPPVSSLHPSSNCPSKDPELAKATGLEVNGQDCAKAAGLEDIVDNCVLDLRERLISDLQGFHRESHECGHYSSNGHRQKPLRPDLLTNASLTSSRGLGSSMVSDESSLKMPATSLHMTTTSLPETVEEDNDDCMVIMSKQTSHKTTSIQFDDSATRNDASSKCRTGATNSSVTVSKKSRTLGSAAPFQLWHCWIECPSPLEESHSPRRWTSARTVKQSRLQQPIPPPMLRAGDTVRGQGICQKMILRPGSNVRIVWDLLSIVMMSYDVLIIPLMVFHMPDSIYFNIMSLIITVFWTFDLLLSFFVGFHAGGIVEMRPKQIAKRYLSTWFTIDMVIVLSDWLSLASKSGSMDTFGVFRVTKSLRIARVLRVVRLLRIVKILALIGEWIEFINNQYVSVMLGIAKFIIIILLINHYIACGWYALAEYHPGNPSRTWVKQLLAASGAEDTLVYRYTTALHWSFTQFTPASMEVTPQNSLERIYAIVILLSALVVFSSFVSGITAAMTTLRQMNLEQNRQSEKLRRYITDRKISFELGNRIHSCLRSQGYTAKRLLVESDVAALIRLPPQLLLDLHVEVYSPLLLPHPFFHQFFMLDESGVMEVCHFAMRDQIVMKDEHIFACGDKGTEMICVSDGSVTYHAENDREKTTMEIGANEYIAEAVLWLRWIHRGDLTGTSSSLLAKVLATEFHSVVQKTTSYESCRTYAHQYLQRVLVLSDVTLDAWYDFDVLQEMAQNAFEEHVEAMSHHEHQLPASTTEGSLIKLTKMIRRFSKAFS